MNDYATIPPSAGALLVAAPSIIDPNFARTVVQLVNHDHTGSLGVVINRPDTSPDPVLAAALGDWLAMSASPGVVFRGGPVSPDSFLCLVSTPSGVRSVDIANEDPAGTPGPWRVFRGYAGWAPGQLDDELRGAGWYVVESEPDDMFSSGPDRLWRDVLARQSGTVRRFADFPDDPFLN
ncbi:MAG: hypothetical protein RLZZ305_1844 [Actinomycetota bacterium]